MVEIVGISQVNLAPVIGGIILLGFSFIFGKGEQNPNKPATASYLDAALNKNALRIAGLLGILMSLMG